MTLRISLIVPTRERAATLEHTLRVATSVSGTDLEIVVSDNASEDRTAEVVSGFSDNRIRAVRASVRLSMRANFELALAHSKGDYVVFIGDDDCILPAQFDALRWTLERHRPDALGWRLPNYTWPGVGYSRKRVGVRLFRHSIFQPSVWVDIERLRLALLAGRVGELDPMPGIYHGCVSRVALLGLSKNGQVFHARSPDIYASYALVLRGCRFLYSPHPFTINGRGPASTGASSLQRAEAGPAAAVARFFSEAATDPTWEALPEFIPCVAYGIFSTFLNAMKVLGIQERPDYRGWFDYVLRGASHPNPEHFEPVVAALRRFAGSAGAQAELEESLAGWDSLDSRLHQKSFSTRWAKFVDELNSFKFSTGRNGENNIYTAALTVDALLPDFRRQLESGRYRRMSWPSLMTRGLASMVTNR